MAFVILVAIVVAIAAMREWILVRSTGWHRLSQKYRCRLPLPGQFRPCWWAQFTNVGGWRPIVVNVGHLTRWPIRLEFPPIWIAASSEGLYLKRNLWNLLHPALLIPWSSIRNAKEATFRDLLCRTTPAGALVRQPKALQPLLAAAQWNSGPLLELQISEPNVSIVAQLPAFEPAIPFLQSKLALSKSQGD
jgi:hypothetical protein